MKYFFLLLNILCCQEFLWGQSYLIDSSFGNNGVQFISTSRELNAIALRSNQELVFAGYQMIPSSINTRMVINALMPDGSPLASFGSNGTQTTMINNMDYAYDCAVQSDGKIIAVGTHSIGNTSSGPAVQFPFIARYQSNGDLDSSFATNGIRKLTLGTESNFAKVKVLASGKILAAGNIFNGLTLQFLLAQLNADGTFDLGFGTNGLVISTFTNDVGLWDLDILQDGSIVVAGNEGPYDPSPNPNFDIQMCLMKFNSFGKVDSSFGTNGIVFHNPDLFTDDIIFNLHEQSDGKLIASGVGNNAGMILRFLSNGILDSTYDGDGIKTPGHVVRVSALQQDDQLITANAFLNGTGQDFKLLRYRNDGSLDTTFGINGMIHHDLPGISNYSHYMILDSVGDIIVCGFSDSTSIVTKYKKQGAGPASIFSSMNKAKDFFVYPNPVLNEISFVVPENVSVSDQFQILDASGKLLHRINASSIMPIQTHTYRLPLKDLAPGQYYLKWISRGGVQTTSFLKWY